MTNNKLSQGRARGDGDVARDVRALHRGARAEAGQGRIVEYEEGRPTSRIFGHTLTRREIRISKISDCFALWKHL